MSLKSFSFWASALTPLAYYMVLGSMQSKEMRGLNYEIIKDSFYHFTQYGILYFAIAGLMFLTIWLYLSSILDAKLKVFFQGLLLALLDTNGLLFVNDMYIPSDGYAILAMILLLPFLTGVYAVLFLIIYYIKGKLGKRHFASTVG